LEDFLVNCSRKKQTVDVNWAGLAISPHASHRLQIVGRIPVNVEEYETGSPHDIETNPARLGRQQKHKLDAVTKTQTHADG
jgi:hypothetical protein